MGYVQSELATGESQLEVSIVGERIPARVLTEAAVDPEGMRLRS